MDIIYKPIGLIHTPFQSDAPYADFEEAAGIFFVEVFKEYEAGLFRLNEFNYCYLIFHLDRRKKIETMHVHPPRGEGKEVGLFASRSPNRINQVGLTIAQIISISGNKIYTKGLDILDQTPLLDIKPYIFDKDCKTDASRGWIKKS